MGEDEEGNEVVYWIQRTLVEEREMEWEVVNGDGVVMWRAVTEAVARRGAVRQERRGALGRGWWVRRIGKGEGKAEGETGVEEGENDRAHREP